MSWREYNILCEYDAPIPPPPIYEQIDGNGWNNGYNWQNCIFRLRQPTSLPDGGNPLPNTWQTGGTRYFESTARNVTTIENAYRCQAHNRPPRVFRQNAAFYRHLEEQQERHYERVIVGQDPRAPWPNETPQEVRESRRPSVFVLRRNIPASHSLWIST